MAKEFAKSFYQSEQWKACRSSYAKSVGWLCERCLEQGLYTPGKVVHHKIHLTPKNISNPDIALGFDNLKLVCQDCHAKEHKGGVEARYIWGEYGDICPPYQKNMEGS